MTAINLSPFKDRIAAMQVEAVSGSTALPYVMDSRLKLPYWTNQLARVAPVGIGSLQKRYDITITMRLHRGTTTEGIPTHLEETCETDIFATLDYFQVRPDLTTTALTTVLTGLVPRSAAVVSEGIVEFTNPSTLGTVYTLTFSIVSVG